MIGDARRSWSVPVFILNGHFPNAFPVDEDPVPVDGNPHPVHGNVLHADAIVHGWQHEAHGASQHVQANLGLNQQQADNVQAELQGQMQVDPAEGWDDWEKNHQGENEP